VCLLNANNQQTLFGTNALTYNLNGDFTAVTVAAFSYVKVAGIIDGSSFSHLRILNVSGRIIQE